MQDVTKEFIRALAAANGITLAEDRLELVRVQYQSFLRGLAEINTLPLPPETEPSITYSLVPPVVPPSGAGK
jgi:hypothetical protein